jgi:hypothetical protein
MSQSKTWKKNAPRKHKGQSSASTVTQNGFVVKPTKKAGRKI